MQRDLDRAILPAGIRLVEARPPGLALELDAAILRNQTTTVLTHTESSIAHTCKQSFPQSTAAVAGLFKVPSSGC